MLLERIYDEDLAQASYVIGCQAEGTAVVVDPRRDIDVYLDVAGLNGMEIVAVMETHIHADYLSGSRELAAATGAQLYVSAAGGTDWQYAFDASRLNDGDVVAIGNVSVRALHTPGHTPEHMSFAVTDGAFSSEPGYLLSGDFVFAGDLGRPDLLDEAAGGVDTRFEGAHQLYSSLQNVFLTLPDHVMVFPGHGAGSACGKSLGALPSTTVGYERMNAWWAPFLQNDDREGFVAELLDGQPDAHAYFARMKRDNRDGPTVLGALPPLTEYSTAEVSERLHSDTAVLVDTRAHEQVANRTVPGSLAIPGHAKTASFGAWAFDPDRESQPLVVLADDQEHAARIRNSLLRVGIDNVDGFVTDVDDLPTSTPASIAPDQLDDFPAALVLDVRNKTEHADGHIPGSRQLSAGRALWHQDELPESGPIVTYCQSGARNTVIASALRRAGHEIHELSGSYAGWSAWKDAQ